MTIAIGTRAELKVMMQRFLQRLDGDDDLDDALDTLIYLAETQMRQELKSRRLKGRTTPAALANPITLPTDFRAIITVVLLDSTDVVQGELGYKTARQQLRAEMDGGTPESYTIEGTSLYIVPYSASYKYRLHYYSHPVLGAGANDTNVILVNYPALYLYGSLLQAAPFLYHDDRIPTWKEFYGRSLGLANEATDEEEFGTMQVSMPDMVAV